MKKHINGFTLIECLIALAILGVASLTMAQIYAGVSRRNRNNQLLNTSLSNQMAYVEKYTASEAVPIYFNESGGASKKDNNASSTDRKPPHKSNDASNAHKNNYVQITRIDASKTGANSRDKDQVYSFPVDTYVLMSRDNNDQSSGTDVFNAQYKDYMMTSNTDNSYNLRYKYLVSHSN